MKGPSSKPHWRPLKARLETFDRQGLLGLIGDLYQASADNRRFLTSRLLPDHGAIEDFRQTVIAAIYPDPFSRRPVSVRDASAAITQYQRATGDPAGTIDLMLTFVEAGTEQAADLGYGDDPYFAALERKLDAIDKGFDRLPPTTQTTVLRRLRSVRDRAKDIGWGYGDSVDEVTRRLERRVGDPKTRPHAHRGRGGEAGA